MMNYRQMQYNLYYLGFYGSSEKDIDGIWGPNSTKATKRFQQAIGISADGIFGVDTETATKNIIYKIQGIIGCYKDGLAGRTTIAATKTYQPKLGLSPTGVCNDNFFTKIGVDLANDAMNGHFTSTNSSSGSASTIPSTPSTSTGSSTTTGSTGTFWDHIKYFNKSEFKCKCGGKYCNGFPHEPVQALVECADDVRAHFGKSMIITSGLRCTKHNAAVGGVYNSRHLTGKAMDFYIPGVSASTILAYVSKLSKIRYSYAINSTCVHMDVN